MKRIVDMEDEELAEYIAKIENHLSTAVLGMLEIADQEMKDRALIRQLRQEAARHELLH